MSSNNYTDFFKAFSDYRCPVDFDGIFSSQRRNIEAVTSANQVVAEGVQAAFRRQGEIARSNTETLLKASKELFNVSSPDQSATKQADFAKTVFENTLSNLREISEMVTKSSYEAFDLLNKRAAESLDELSKVASSTTQKRKAS